MNLKHIHPEAVSAALALAERYRLLNEPEQAASICRDILEIRPDDQAALRMLLLSLTDEFGISRGAGLQDAEKAAKQLSDRYERTYYLGVVY
jgi:hypothetical protein